MPQIPPASTQQMSNGDTHFQSHDIRKWMTCLIFVAYDPEEQVD